MTTLDHSLLAAVVAAPADDAVRLICADWLEEHGDLTRAEFFRLQVVVAAAEEGCSCGRCVKRRGGGQHTNGGCATDRVRMGGYPATLRIHDLQDERGGDWFRADRGISPGAPIERNAWMYRPLAPLGPSRYWLGYRRGFLAVFDGPLQDWLDCGAELVRRYPLERVVVSNRVPHNDYVRSWGWITAERPGDSELPSCLPADLYACLPAGEANTPPWSGWHTLEAAQRALSVACLAWARSRSQEQPCPVCRGKGSVRDDGPYTSKWDRVDCGACDGSGVVSASRPR